MLAVRGILLGLLAVVAGGFSAVWARHAFGRARRALADGPASEPGPPRASHLAIGAGTNFFDTLGIGSFAPTTSLFKLLRLVPDQHIPGTLLVGHSLPMIAQALIYITIIEVEMTTLALLIAASVVGAWLGGGVVARWPRRKIQVGMGLALLGAASVMLMQLLGVVPGGGDSLGLSGARLAIGLAGNLVLGALMTIGIGAYAPSLILFGLLGMNTKSIFPVMMGSCAFLSPVGALQFLKHGSYGRRAALGLTLGGIPAVLVAAYVVKELPLAVLRWFVVAVVVYTAAAMLRSATKPET